MSTSAKIILFQGDSITDAGRSRGRDLPNDAAALGRGYPLLIAGRLLEKSPGDGLNIYNRGIGGDRSVDLAARWEQDTLALKPTILSVLIGVNDTWHSLGANGAERHVPLDQYETLYRTMLTDARAALPGIKLVLCEPFVLPCGAVTEAWFPDFTGRRDIVKKLAAEFGAVFVPFQDVFDRHLDHAPAEAWADDGVHPTLAGHSLMASTWLDAVRERGLV